MGVGISKQRCEKLRDDGSLLVHRNAGIGPGFVWSDAAIGGLWKGKAGTGSAPIKPNVSFKLVSPPEHLNRGLVKMGDFEDMARARKKKRGELASKKAQRLATKAASAAELASLELQFVKRLVECDACGEMHTKKDHSQYKHHCGLKLKEKCHTTCCMCGARGHLTCP